MLSVVVARADIDMSKHDGISITVHEVNKTSENINHD